MKRLLLLVFLLPLISFSQCPPDGEFNSQAEIDAFAIDYPDCTILNGNFVISGDDITDLSGLAQITACTNLSISNNLVLQNTNGLNPNILLSYVEGTGSSFLISNNAALLEITGLENLQNLSGFESDFGISNNPMLTSLEGLPIFFDALDFISISNNDSLTNLIGMVDGSPDVIFIGGNDGLVDLTGVGGISAETIYIDNNNALQSLNGSELMIYADYLYIENNQNLTDVSTIYAGGSTSTLIIRNNSNLSICSSANVCQYIYTRGIEEGEWFPGTFENNAPGCNSNYEVEYACGLLTNDDCEMWNFPNSFNSLTLGETIQANNEFATTSSFAPSCNEVTDRQDVWFVFDSEGSTSVDIIVETGFNLQLWDTVGVLYPECGYQTQVESACNNESLIDIPVTPNTFYLVQVWNDDGGRLASGWFNILVQDGLLSTPEFELDTINVYPNPAQNELHIQSIEPIDTIQMFNLLGQQVLESKATTLDISNLNEGLYLVKVMSSGRETTYKIVKQ